MRVPTVVRIGLIFLVVALLSIRTLDVYLPDSILEASADMTWPDRLSRLMGDGDTASQPDRVLRITVHVFEARSTGVLPLALPPLEAAAVTRYGERVFDMVRDTAQYYRRLVALYPAAQFELLNAEEAVLPIGLSSANEVPGKLAFHARDYTVRVNPSSLDKSNWLTAQIVVEHDGDFLLGNRVTSLADGTPLVIGGPVEGVDTGGDGRAVFIGLTARYERNTVTDEDGGLFFTEDIFDHPPRLVEMAEVRPPTLDAATSELEGMPIYLVHIDPIGRVIGLVLVSSLRDDYDAAAESVVMASKFSPARRQETTVESWMFVSVNFQAARRSPGVSAPKVVTE